MQRAEGTDATGVAWRGRCETKPNLTRVSQGGSRDRPASGIDDADWFASYLPDEPTTLQEAKVSSKWPQWRGALKREMDGQIARCVWKVVDQPKGKIVLGTKTVLKRKVGVDGRVEKYK